MNRFPLLFAAPVLSVALAIGPAFASPGHDHADEVPAVAAGPASPRFETHSGLFEIVGVLEGDELSVFVDRFADNAPVLQARVELESGSTKAIGQFHEDRGDYSFAAASFQEPGSYSIALTITAGDESDLLAANLVVPDGHAEHEHEESSHLLQRFGFAALALAALAGLGWGIRRRQKRRSTGGMK